jgi:hypothetical protein
VLVGDHLHLAGVDPGRGERGRQLAVLRQLGHEGHLRAELLIGVVEQRRSQPARDQEPRGHQRDCHHHHRHRGDPQPQRHGSRAARGHHTATNR